MSMLSGFGDEEHSVFDLVTYWLRGHGESRDEAKVKPRFAPRGEKLGETRR
jgi:redox-sensitive bicupin YhaK (pirin superfamily)